jgi:small subunit ribosomal protein S1
MNDIEENVKDEVFEEESFKDLYEQSLDRVKEGEVVTGTILNITKDFATIDIGYKSEGQIATKEFLDDDGNLTVNVGDEVEVFLEKKEDESGSIVISKGKADQLRVWDDIKNACEEEGVVEGRIIQRIKGGFRVDIKGLTAFLPGSQVDIKPVLNQDALVGKKYEFRVLKYSRSKENIVLSRKILLEKERQKMRGETLKVLEEGAVLEGMVKNTTDYGIFVDLGGIDGLLHITDISWGRVGKPSQYYSIGEPITTKVLKYDREKEKVSLGLKQLKEDPWLTAQERYPVGSKKKGKVVNITDYGAFVELEEGVEGLVHISEMSWMKKIKHPSQIVSLEEEVEVIVLDVDVKKTIIVGDQTDN